MQPLTRLLHRPDDWYAARLAPPTGRVRVVLDTDAANEIDDPFAIAWALLAPERLDLLAVYAAPYSFEHRRAELLRARVARDRPHEANAWDHELLRQHAAMLAHFEHQSWPIETVSLEPFVAPAEGMRRSLKAIEAVFDVLGRPHAGRVFAGSTRYTRADAAPERSAAVEHLIATARATPADQPLYVVAIGCVTNIANALLLAPEITERVVVVWTAGYPSHAPQPNFAFNLEQDMTASALLFDCGVPLVYLPGYHVGAQLRLSHPEAALHLQGRGALGEHLYHLYTHNPLWPMLGIRSLLGHSWVIWDLINIAWLLNPAWVPSDIVRTPRLRDDRRWASDAARHPMREAYAVQRDAVFADLFAKIGTVA
jgi:inosine-uridine nucleoside N-ribohydrolase